MLKPVQQLPAEIRKRVRFVLTDIDDTLTSGGRLPAAALAAMERLEAAGKQVVPVTGRPAGWCDHIARMWPVAAVVGENGAFYFRYDRARRRMERSYFKAADDRAADRRRLEALQAKILAEVPGCAVSADQAFREADLAIDVCEDVPALSPAAVDRIVQIFAAAGAQAKVSSIHVNGWFGAYDKLAMTRRLFREAFQARPGGDQDPGGLCRRLPQRSAHVRVFSQFGGRGQCQRVFRAHGGAASLGHAARGRFRVRRDGRGAVVLNVSFRFH